MSRVLCLCVMLGVLLMIVLPSSSSSSVNSASSNFNHLLGAAGRGGAAKDKTFRLCLWTQCRPKNWNKKCFNSLVQTARRRCRLASGEMGYYSKCCIYEEQLYLGKN